MPHLSTFVALSTFEFAFTAVVITSPTATTRPGRWRSLLYLQDRARTLVPLQLLGPLCRGFHAQGYLHRLFQGKIILSEQGLLNGFTAEPAHQPVSQCF